MKSRALTADNSRRLICLAVYIAVSILLAVRHEPWYDEARAWEIAKVISPSNFQQILSNEGHPCLWYIFLIPFARLGFPYVCMKYISVAVMTVTGGILIFAPQKRCPLGLPARAVILFSPLFVYYYSAISRSYCLAALLTVLTALFWNERREHPVRLCVVVALLLQTHVFVTGFCFGICVVMLAEAVMELKKDKKRAVKIMAVLIIPLMSALFYFVEFKYIFDHSVLSRGDKGMDGYLVPFVMQLYFLLGDIGMFLLVPVIIGMLIFLYVRIRYKHDKSMIPAVAVFFISCVILALISHYYLTNTRGFFLIGYWGLFLVWNIKTDKDEKIRFIPLSVIAVLTVGLWIHHAEMVADDYNYLFSDAANAAEVLNGLPSGTVIYDFCAFPGESLLPYLEEDTVFLPVDDHVFEDDITYWYERQVAYLDNVLPARYIREHNPDYKEIYILYPLGDKNHYKIPPEYCDTVFLSAGYDHEIIYTSPDTVFYGQGIERYGIMRIEFPDN